MAQFRLRSGELDGHRRRMCTPGREATLGSAVDPLSQRADYLNGQGSIHWPKLKMKKLGLRSSTRQAGELHKEGRGTARTRQAGELTTQGRSGELAGHRRRMCTPGREATLRSVVDPLSQGADYRNAPGSIPWPKLKMKKLGLRSGTRQAGELHKEGRGAARTR
ncbi:hypothetical protein Droror1_Dr00002326 [Drosera rotundifolia]